MEKTPWYFQVFLKLAHRHTSHKVSNDFSLSQKRLKHHSIPHLHNSLVDGVLDFGGPNTSVSKGLGFFADSANMLACMPAVND